jgi:hypothetical protein
LATCNWDCGDCHLFGEPPVERARRVFLPHPASPKGEGKGTIPARRVIKPLAIQSTKAPPLLRGRRGWELLVTVTLRVPDQGIPSRGGIAQKEWKAFFFVQIGRGAGFFLFVSEIQGLHFGVNSV